MLDDTAYLHRYYVIPKTTTSRLWSPVRAAGRRAFFPHRTQLARVSRLLVWLCTTQCLIKTAAAPTAPHRERPLGQSTTARNMGRRN